MALHNASNRFQSSPRPGKTQPEVAATTVHIATRAARVPIDVLSSSVHSLVDLRDTSSLISPTVRDCQNSCGWRNSVHRGQRFPMRRNPEFPAEEHCHLKQGVCERKDDEYEFKKNNCLWPQYVQSVKIDEITLYE
ncbi:hypothetical protein OS493_039684, partial [Desmophyllum pertusum]